MAPPEPPPLVPGRVGLAPCPIARLCRNTLLSTVHETPMLLSPEPLLQRPPRNVLPTTYAGARWDCERSRTAAPPRSGPERSQRLSRNVASTILSCPPRTKIAPPPPPSTWLPVEFPRAKVTCWTTSFGRAWSSQWSVVQI